MHKTFSPHTAFIREEQCCWNCSFSVACPLRVSAKRQRWTGEQRQRRNVKANVPCGVKLPHDSSAHHIHQAGDIPCPCWLSAGPECQANWDALQTTQLTGWAQWRAQQIHLGVLSSWPSGLEQWKEHRTSRRWREEGRNALMATKVRFLTGYTVKISRRSVSYFWYFPNNVVLTITFALSFLPIVCVRFSKLRCCSTSAVIFPLNCGSTPKNVSKMALWETTAQCISEVFIEFFHITGLKEALLCIKTANWGWSKREVFSLLLHHP